MTPTTPEKEIRQPHPPISPAVGEARSRPGGLASSPGLPASQKQVKMRLATPDADEKQGGIARVGTMGSFPGKAPKAEPRKRPETPESTCADGQTTMSHAHEAAAALCAAASEGDDIALEALLQVGYNVNKGDYDRRTALHLAAEEGHLSCVEVLVSYGADINCRDRWGTTPLKGAVQNLQNEVANYLRDHGAKISDDAADTTLYGQQRRNIRIWFDRCLQFCGLAPDGEACPVVGVAGYLYSEHGINVLKNRATAAELASLRCALRNVSKLGDAEQDIKSWISTGDQWYKNTFPPLPSTLYPRKPKREKNDGETDAASSRNADEDDDARHHKGGSSEGSTDDSCHRNISYDLALSEQLAKDLYATYGRSILTLSQLTVASIGEEPKDRKGAEGKAGSPELKKKLEVVAGGCPHLRNIVLGRLEVANWRGFVESILDLAGRVLDMGNDGKNADYIPELAEDRVDPSLFGIAICTVDGQQLAVGDMGSFTIQSCGKPFVYAQCVEEYGQDHVHSFVGQEPSGRAFNDFALTPKGQPFNAVTNAGAMMCASLYHPEETLQDRTVRYLGRVRRFCGEETVDVDESVFKSEQSTAYRNHAIANFMMSEGCYPAQVNTIPELQRHVDFYLRTCAVRLNCQMLSNMAATLAHYGECPLTNEKLLSFTTVKQALQLAYSCGMYNSSGEWACTVGIPAKSGVSGCIWLAVPGVLGLCVRSPRLDSVGNSVRATRFSRQFAERFQWGVMDLLYRAKDGSTT